MPLRALITKPVSLHGLPIGQMKGFMQPFTWAAEGGGPSPWAAGGLSLKRLGASPPLGKPGGERFPWVTGGVGPFPWATVAVLSHGRLGGGVDFPWAAGKHAALKKRFELFLAPIYYVSL